MLNWSDGKLNYAVSVFVSLLQIRLPADMEMRHRFSGLIASMIGWLTWPLVLSCTSFVASRLVLSELVDDPFGDLVRLVSSRIEQTYLHENFKWSSYMIKSNVLLVHSASTQVLAANVESLASSTLLLFRCEGMIGLSFYLLDSSPSLSCRLSDAWLLLLLLMLLLSLRRWSWIAFSCETHQSKRRSCVTSSRGSPHGTKAGAVSGMVC